MKLRVPQIRVLRTLTDGSLLTRSKINDRAGISQVSGTVWRALNGLKEGSSSGAPHLGLLALGYVEEHRIDVDGVEETGYMITKAGKDALRDVDDPPQMRDRVASTNKRYSEKS